MFLKMFWSYVNFFLPFFENDDRFCVFFFFFLSFLCWRIFSSFLEWRWTIFCFVLPLWEPYFGLSTLHVPQDKRRTAECSFRQYACRCSGWFCYPSFISRSQTNIFFLFPPQKGRIKVDSALAAPDSNTLYVVPWSGRSEMHAVEGRREGAL